MPPPLRKVTTLQPLLLLLLTFLNLGPSFLTLRTIPLSPAVARLPDPIGTIPLLFLIAEPFDP